MGMLAETIVVALLIILIIFFTGTFIDRTVNSLGRIDRSCVNDSDTAFGPIGCGPCEEDVINKNYKPFCTFTRISFYHIMAGFADYECEDPRPHYSICKDGVASRPSTIEEFFRACNKLELYSHEKTYYEIKDICFRDSACHISKISPDLSIGWCTNATLLLQETLKTRGYTDYLQDCAIRAGGQLENIDIDKTVKTCEDFAKAQPTLYDSQDYENNYNKCIDEISVAVNSVDKSKAFDLCKKKLVDPKHWGGCTLLNSTKLPPTSTC